MAQGTLGQPKISSTAQGNAFRDQVKELLALRGGNPRTEKLVAGKAADIFWEFNDLGRNLRVAVETKSDRRSLDRRYLNSIIADYLAAYNSNEIDLLWVVGINDIAGSHAREIIDKNARWVQFFTFDSLRKSLMDFGQYVESLIYDYTKEGLDQYYLDTTGISIQDHAGPSFPRSADPLIQQPQPCDLETEIDKWIASQEKRPIAIIGGYGIGKTSFAKRLAYRAATHLRESKNGRVPIYIELGRIAAQQKLSGLLGTLFTDEYHVNGYQYNFFCRLNDAGNFLIILDGFDEMKHMMTLEDFRYNFSELNRLVEGNAKVILLGRPSAFSSESESEWILHGRHPVDGQLVQLGGPNYLRYHILPFNSSKIHKFVKEYLTYLLSKTTIRDQSEIDQQFIDRRTKEITEIDYGDLLERPVQAKMLVELAADPGGELRKKFTRFGLYEYFIDRYIVREMLKPERRGIPGEQRRQFMRALAWWLWTNNKTLGVRLEEIPDAVFQTDAGDLSPVTEARRRELIVGSILDEKDRNTFFIPHRSFLEFLVSERLCDVADKPDTTQAVLKGHSSLLTSDVLTFVQESEKGRQFFEMVYGLLFSIEGYLSYDFIRNIGKEVWMRKLLEDRKERPGPISAEKLPPWSSWHVFAWLLPLARGDGQRGAEKMSESSWEEVRRFVFTVMALEPTRHTLIAPCILVLLSLLSQEEIRDEVGKIIITALMIATWHRHNELRPSGSSISPDHASVVNVRDVQGKLLRAFIEGILRNRLENTSELCFSINAVSLAQGLLQALSPECQLVSDLQIPDQAAVYFVDNPGNASVYLSGVFQILNEIQATHGTMLIGRGRMQAAYSDVSSFITLGKGKVIFQGSRAQGA